MNRDSLLRVFSPRLMALLALLGGGLAAPAADTNSPGEARFLARVRQLTFEGRRAGEGYFAPDGRALVFQSEREPGNPFYQIYTLDLATGESRRVSPGFGKTTCAFFRPGRDELLFASTHLDPAARDNQKAELDARAAGQQRRYAWDYDEHFDIFAARRDGARPRRLTDAPGYDAEAAYSPDGRKVVFCSLRGAYPTNQLSATELKRFETDPAWFGEIYLMNADGSDVRRLTHAPGYDGGPFFSPDGRRIVWRRFDERGEHADIFTMNLDGSDVRRLTDFKSMSWAPYFHPSGRYVIFTSNKYGFGNFELHLVDAAGRHEPARVTFTDGFDGLPVFSPDGRQLCWTSSRAPDGKSQLFLADWNHAAALAALGLAAAEPAARREQAKRASPAANPRAVKRLRAAVQFLVSTNLEGRATGSAGAQRAADFLARQARAAGLKPLRTDGTFFQPFEFNAGVRVRTNECQFTLARSEAATPAEFEAGRDFLPLAFTASGVAEGEVVFAGYGLFVPGQPGEGYDSYAGLDVSNKVVLALRYVPEEVAPRRRAELNRYAGLRYKAMLARERGAKAVLFVTGPNSPGAGALAGLAFDSSFAGSGIVAASISSNTANALLAGAGKDLKALQSALDKEDPHAPGGFALTNARVRLAVVVEYVKKTDRNVIAVIPPGRPAGPAEYVLVGAHYDHLGYGESGALLRKGEENKIHFGADDNASGTAALLELAAALAAERKQQPAAFQRGVIVAFWSGEENGLIGSSFFAEHPPVPLSNVVACVNFDMVGRLRDDRLVLQGVGSSTVWPRLIERRAVPAAFSLTLQEDPYLPTDVTAFYPKRVPVLSFFTGSHEDYHRPTDTAEKLNYDGLARIADFARGLVRDLAQAPHRPDYVTVASSRSGSGGRETLRAYLGTIPDYTAEVQGVKLAGVRAGGPADKAGLQAGDVIVEFAGQKIANVYDYTYAMDAVKIGQPVPVVVQRDGQRVTLTVVPEARK